MYRLNEPLIGAADVEAVVAVMESGWIGLDGEGTVAFEEAFAKRHGNAYGVAVQSGTAATHVAVWAVAAWRANRMRSVWPRVAVPDFTCSAPAAAVVQAGLTPVIVGIERETLAMDAEALEEAWRVSPFQSVLLVHVYGAPARDAMRIADWCREHDVSLIEDCCEAHGATYPDGRSVGTLGDAAVFSIRSEKMIGVGEGGVAVTNDLTLSIWMETFANRGKTRDDQWWWRFYTEYVGANYKLPATLGAFALSQLTKLDGFLARRKEIARLYRELLPEFDWQTMPEGGAAWLEFLRFPVGDGAGYVFEREGLSPQVKAVGQGLFARGVEVRPGFFPIRRHGAFRKYDVASGLEWTAADQAVWSGLCVPSHPGLSNDDVSTIAGEIRAEWEKAR
jgi:perosamine synthetase